MQCGLMYLSSTFAVTVDPRGRHMTVNSNCLEGLRCPNCGQNNCFVITAIRHAQVHLYDDGTDESIYGSVEWEDNAPCSCPECNWAGVAGNLPWMGKIPPIFKSNLITLVEYAKLTVQECTHEEALEEMDLEDHAFENTLEFLNDLLTEIG